MLFSGIPHSGIFVALSQAKQLDAASGMMDRWKLVVKIFWESSHIFILSAGRQWETGHVVADLEVKLTHPPPPLQQLVQHVKSHLICKKENLKGEVRRNFFTRSKF